MLKRQLLFQKKCKKKKYHRLKHNRYNNHKKIKIQIQSLKIVKSKVAETHFYLYINLRSK